MKTAPSIPPPRITPRTCGRLVSSASMRVEGAGESFDYPRRAQFDPSTFFDGHFGIYQRQDRASKVELIFKGSPWLKVNL